MCSPRARAASWLVMLTVAAGCASTSPAPAFREVARMTAERGATTLRWDENTALAPDAERVVDALLAEPLSADTAVKIGLLASPRLWATLEELSIAQADLVQAGLLKNPVLTVGRTAWEGEHLEPNLFGVIEQNFLDIVTQPLRKRVAAAELEETTLEVSDRVLGLGAEVGAAFYAAQAAEQIAEVLRMVTDAEEASAELARRRYEAGNASELAMKGELALASRARISLLSARREGTVARERLTKLMGLWGRRAAFRISPRLPELPEADVGLERLEALAIEKRLDVAAARRQVESLRYAASLVRTTRWTGVVNVSVEAGRLSGSRKLSFGPSVSLEIPLFDQRQAAIARLDAFTRKAQDNLEALAIEARSDVRAHHARVAATRKIVEEYGTSLVPIRESIVQLAQQQYEAMLLGVPQLVLAKQGEFEAYREYVEALRDYWIARVDLERAVGTSVGVAEPARGRAEDPGRTPPALTPGGAHPSGRQP